MSTEVVRKPINFQEVQLAKLSDLQISGNVRKMGAVEEHNVLLKSIKEAGILVPLLVYQVKDKLRIVDGLRRYQAAKLLELEKVPVIVADFPESTASVQVAMNTILEDLHPLDEARVYKELSKNGRPEKEVAAIVGKPVVYVRRRLLLNNLIEPVKKAVLDGRFGVSCAEVLGAYPPETQSAYVKDKWHLNEHDPDDVRRHFQQEREKLSAAPWGLDNATLVPKAGACTACLKRTSKETLELFGKNVAEDECLDNQCFRHKLLTHVSTKVREAQRSNPGQKIVVVNRESWADTKTIGGVKILGHDDFKTLPSPDVKKVNKASIGITYDAEHPKESGKVVKVALKGDYEASRFTHRSTPSQKAERKKGQARRERYGALLKELIEAKDARSALRSIDYLAAEQKRSLQHYGAVEVVRSLKLEVKKGSYGQKDYTGAARAAIGKLKGIRLLVVCLLISDYYRYTQSDSAVAGFAKAAGINLPKAPEKKPARKKR